MGQKRRLVYSKQTRILYIKFSIRIAIWKLVDIAISAASCGVFQGESESAFRIALLLDKLEQIWRQIRIPLEKLHTRAHFQLIYNTVYEFVYCIRSSTMVYSKQTCIWNMGKLYASLFTIYKCPPLVISIPMSALTKVRLDKGLPRRRSALTKVRLNQSLPHQKIVS